MNALTFSKIQPHTDTTTFAMLCCKFWHPASRFHMFLQLANLLLVVNASRKPGLARFATS